MGLDQYFYASKTLSAFKKKEKLYIDFFNTLTHPDLVKEQGLYIFDHWGDTQEIREVLRTLPKLYGQVNDIKMIKKVGNDYIISTEAMYWRKSNQIQNWFVEVCQDGIDDNCGFHPVGVNHLIDLQERIDKVLDGLVMPYSDKFFNSANNWMAPPATQSLAMDLLPTTSGFFFGSTDYNKWYYYDLQITKKFLRKVLKQSTSKDWSFIYHSSY